MLLVFSVFMQMQATYCSITRRSFHSAFQSGTAYRLCKSAFLQLSLFKFVSHSYTVKYCTSYHALLKHMVTCECGAVPFEQHSTHYYHSGQLAHAAKYHIRHTVYVVLCCSKCTLCLQNILHTVFGVSHLTDLLSVLISFFLHVFLNGGDGSGFWRINPAPMQLCHNRSFFFFFFSDLLQGLQRLNFVHMYPFSI